jgi:conserved oligomeric Golgi complex subunit 3
VQARIAELTAGPATKANVINTDTHTTQNQNEGLFMKAMTPPLQVSSSVSNNLSLTMLGNVHDVDSTFVSNDDAIMVQETIKESAKVLQNLKTQLKYTTSLKLALRACNNIAKDISNRHTELIRHSGELSAAADRLQEEEQILTKHAQEIGLPLQHYDAVDIIGISVGVLFKGKTTVRGLAKVKVDSDEFPKVLDDIDKAIAYFGNECGGKEALQAELKRRSASNKKESAGELLSGGIEYYRRALALQEAALDQIKEAVDERIRTTTQQVSAALNIAKGNVVQADQLEASPIYTRFHGISSRSNRLLSLLKERLTTSKSTIMGDDNSGVIDAYQELLQLCLQTYCSCRESLLRTTIRSQMDKLKDKHGPVGMTRLASVFLIRLCTVETALYIDFFGSNDGPKNQTNDTLNASKSRAGQQLPVTDDSAFKSPEFQAYLTSLCTSLHRTVRRALVTMNDLDSLCQIVSVLREERTMASASPTTMAAARAITNVIQDAQERLIFCANSTLQKEVIKFQATSSDLNYPEKLRRPNKPNDTTMATSSADDDVMEQQLQQVYESWFPPIRTVLKILSKIFRVVETRVFEDMALQSVRSCTKCLKDGAEYIKSHQSEMDADLFLVKHFLILREQLSPFDIELRSVERQLDFSDAGKAVARFLANRNRRVFSVSTENALVTLLREGVSVQEASVDSKRDLEDALRSSCNDFIEHTAHLVAHDLLNMAESYKMRDGTSSSDLTSVESIISMLKGTTESIDDKLTNVKIQMSLYLDNVATQSILLKPVSRKIIRALEEIRKLSHVPDHGWDDVTKGQVIEWTHMLEETVKVATRATK